MVNFSTNLSNFPTLEEAPDQRAPTETGEPGLGSKRNISKLQGHKLMGNQLSASKADRHPKIPGLHI